MDPSSLVLRLLKSLAGWLWVIAVIGAARTRFAHHRSPAPTPAHPARPALPAPLGRYANEAVLPFYVLHETVIVLVAYLVLARPVAGAAQYALIAVISLAATLLLYDPN